MALDLRLSDEDIAFRDEVRRFMADNLPPDIAQRSRRGYHPTREDVQRWKRILNQRGWSVPNWPADYGGPGWSPLQRYLFQCELKASGAPEEDLAATELFGPVLYTFGTAEQKEKYLPAIRNADTFWCQGFSEPGAGSDLSSLKTRAIRDGDVYIVNGQKIWTSEAHKADMMFALVRTAETAKPQAGISFLMIDMHAPGITVRPIHLIDEGHSVNEVFLDNVRVPAENLVGQENSGWAYAKFLLTNERAMSAEVPHTLHDLHTLKQFANAERPGAEPLRRDPDFSNRLCRFEIELMALETAVQRVLFMEQDDPELNATASVLKLRGAALRQQVSELSVEALGEYGLAVYPDHEGQDRMPNMAPIPPVPDAAAGVLAQYVFRRATTIYGGSNEIQRTIIAKSVLGL